MAPTNSKLAAIAVLKAREALHSRYDETKGPLLPLGPRQKASRQDRGAPASLWTSPLNLPAPQEDDVRDALETNVATLGHGGKPSSTLQSAPVVAEWVGLKRGRAVACGDTPAERLEALSIDTDTAVTIIFVHGGAFIQNGLGTSRPTAAKLAKESGGRVVVLDYRLAPQHAFPNQILDLLVLYLSLLYPPLGSTHKAVPAPSIVVAGESVGACIAVSFIQALLHMQNQNLCFNGQKIPIPMPAGASLLSCMGEQALCLPSWSSNRQFDIWAEQAPYLDPDFPADDIWPSHPPREEPYCEASFLDHPLVSPCTAESWKGAPPLWFGVGQECMVDSCKVIAQSAARDGVCVWWDQYEAMPHCWPFLMPKFPHSVDAFGRWGQSCRRMVEGKELQCRGRWIGVEKLEESDIDVKNMIDLEPKEAKAMIKAKAATKGVFYGRRASSHL